MALAQVLSCEFCEIFKDTFFIEHLWWLLFCNYNTTTHWFKKFTLHSNLLRKSQLHNNYSHHALNKYFLLSRRNIAAH